MSTLILVDNNQQTTYLVTLFMPPPVPVLHEKITWHFITSVSWDNYNEMPRYVFYREIIEYSAISICTLVVCSRIRVKVNKVPAIWFHRVTNRTINLWQKYMWTYNKIHLSAKICVYYWPGTKPGYWLVDPEWNCRSSNQCKIKFSRW